MDNFKVIRELVPFRAVVEKYIGEIKNGFVKCPAHAEKTASCKVYENNIHCFGCGYRADAVKIVADALGVKPLEAARVLNEEYSLGLNLDNPDKGKLRRVLRERDKQKREREKKKKALNRKVVKLSERLRACRTPKNDIWEQAEANAEIAYLEYVLDELMEES
jgi:DNA primase